MTAPDGSDLVPPRSAQTRRRRFKNIQAGAVDVMSRVTLERMPIEIGISGLIGRYLDEDDRACLRISCKSFKEQLKDSQASDKNIFMKGKLRRNLQKIKALIGFRGGRQICYGCAQKFFSKFNVLDCGSSVSP